MTSKRGSRGHQSTAVTALRRSKPASFRSNRQTGTIDSTARPNTGPSTAAVALTMAFENRLSIKTAEVFSATKSGSTYVLSPGDGLFLVRGPVQDPFFPDVEEPTEYKDDEEQHLEESKKLQLAIDDGPRIQEDRFDIEQNKDHRHKIEFDTETLAGIPHRFHSRFIWTGLYGIFNSSPQNRREADHRSRDSNCNDYLN